MATWKEKEEEEEAPYLCSPWGFSSLVRTFLSLVLWAAGSHFSCFTQRRTDPQVSLQNTEAMWTGEVYLTARLHRDLTAHTHTFTLTARCCCCCCWWWWWWEGSLILLAVPPSTLLFVLPQCEISGLNSAGQPEKFDLSKHLILMDLFCFSSVRPCNLIPLSNTHLCLLWVLHLNGTWTCMAKHGDHYEESYEEMYESCCFFSVNLQDRLCFCNCTDNIIETVNAYMCSLATKHLKQRKKMCSFGFYFERSYISVSSSNTHAQ